ncbi:MAE_28990/MAE_18760 family HEPN-like nuclease [Amycolatopsis sp. NPDC052450]|uniref:MAE_28990/MAE_18760 family HEPN-like nuclease n=1 Tax=Amycolatopsis sp. NPDC052450 TaxID=3363937 RepID=UPI0037C72AB4
MRVYKTESLEAFVDSIQEVEILLSAEERPEKSLPEPGSRRGSRDLKNALSRAGHVMLVAHFEGFVKSSLTEFVDAICDAKPPSRRVPDALLELFTKERIQELSRIEDGKQRASRTRRLFAVYSDLWDEDRSINPKLVSGTILARQFTNAGPESLGAALMLIGAEDPIDEIQADVRARGEFANVNVGVKLQEIVDKRNKIAHGDLSEKPMYSEVRDYLLFLLKVAEAIDKLIARRIDFSCSLR